MILKSEGYKYIVEEFYVKENSYTSDTTTIKRYCYFDDVNKGYIKWTYNWHNAAGHGEEQLSKEEAKEAEKIYQKLKRKQKLYRIVNVKGSTN